MYEVKKIEENKKYNLNKVKYNLNIIIVLLVINATI